LGADATLKEMLEYAYAANADLEKLYWDWVAAIEAIPQEASPMTNLAISVESMFEEGKTSLKQTTLGVGNDPMGNIPWPGKLSTAGRRALEMARAAGLRFQAGKLELRARVLGAYCDYALLAESIRLKQSEVSLLGTAADAMGARVRTGAAMSADLLAAENTRDLAASELSSLNSKIPGEQAMLNALLSREPTTAIDLPGELPPARELPYTDAEVLAFLAERNPELAALAREAAANEQAVKMARQQYIPDLGLTASGDLGGMTRSIMAMVTAPVVRHEAIEASIRQARAELAASRAMRRQAESDLKADAVLALYDLRDAQRQASLLDGTIIPRASQMADVARAGYSAGQMPIGDVVEAERMLLAMRQMSAEMHVEREKMLAEVERLAGIAP
jgi:outer membrane protein, heavy metal efflux system